MSVTLERLRALKREAGGPAGARSQPAPPGAPQPSHGRSPPTPGPRLPSSVPVRSANPADAHATAPASTSIDTLRRLLGVRERAPAYPAAARGPVDRSLPGDEIAPGLRLLEDWLPFPAPADALPLAFARRDDMVDPRDLLFFDTETTGLAGGTGTRAFQIGAADWHVHPLHGDGLRVRQLLITTLAAETTMLREFARWLSPSTVLSSYNGRCYDAPLLKTRYRLARLPCPITPLDHVDLLFPTRRRYRGVWENCRLATIERELLGIVREDDLPGSQAPAAWLSYLRGGASSLLRRVCAHNHQDVVTLARLMLRLVAVEHEASVYATHTAPPAGCHR
ncbi:ribonuclease H-like domain-containing protein [Lysobacter sp. F60174L2]|uniref:ribonuclease H-like domain-containing protein n=1 Tax=Lysobacter sp. F60174L2 TaxID=3459295 RepID=UPI00403E1320